MALLERSLGDDPELGLTNFLVGRAYVELKRFHQARVHLRRALVWAESGARWADRTREPLVAGAEDCAAVLSELARAEARRRQNTDSDTPLTQPSPELRPSQVTLKTVLDGLLRRAAGRRALVDAVAHALVS